MSATGTARGRRAAARILALLALVVPACGGAGPSARPAGDQLVVSAAASLQDAFRALGQDFERTHPGVQVMLNFAGTQELQMQLEHGADADVFASADQDHMRALVAAGRVAAPVVFARNEPVLVVAKDAAATIRGLSDLPQADRVVIGVADVPIGRYTLQVLDRAAAQLGGDFRARVEAKVVSRELNVRQVLAKVLLGEAQAGIVYRTDARAAPELAVVDIPAGVNVIADYPIAVVNGAAHAALAHAWLDYVLSRPGQRILRHAGFLAPAGER